MKSGVRVALAARLVKGGAAHGPVVHWYAFPECAKKAPISGKALGLELQEKRVLQRSAFLLQLEACSVPRVAGSDGSAHMEQPLKVMVIDDSRTIRRTAQMLLGEAGCEVVTACDGFDALAKIVDHQPRIIFADVLMPRLDGYQTCALIKHNSAFKDTPVILLSSRDGLFDKARGRMMGCDQFLAKPFSKDELLDAIKAHVPGFAAQEQHAP